MTQQKLRVGEETGVKIRWTADSVRFRITPSEMERLEKGETVEENLTFGAGQWMAQIVPASRTRILFLGGRLAIELGVDDLVTLAAPENEGVYFHQDILPNRYFIEKDYPCAHPRGGEAMEPVTETFAMPEGFSEGKLGA